MINNVLCRYICGRCALTQHEMPNGLYTVFFARKISRMFKYSSAVLVWTSLAWIIKSRKEVASNLRPEYLCWIWPVDDRWSILWARYLVYRRNGINLYFSKEKTLFTMQYVVCNNLRIGMVILSLVLLISMRDIIPTLSTDDVKYMVISHWAILHFEFSKAICLPVICRFWEKKHVIAPFLCHWYWFSKQYKHSWRVAVGAKWPSVIRIDFQLSTSIPATVKR